MKKSTVILSTLLISSILVTGCSWGDVKNKFTGEDTASGSAVSGSAVIEIEDYNPEECVTLPEYKGVEVDCTVKADEIKADIDSDLGSHSKEKKIKDRACKSGDTVNIDYEGKADGKAFDGGTAKEQDLVLGSGSMIPGFEDGIVGMKPGEQKDVKVTFPKDYNTKELAGKDAVFTIKLNFIKKTIIPKLTEEYVKKNTDHKSIDEYKKSVEEKLAKQKKDSAPSNAFGKVLEKVEVKKYPKGLKEVYIEQLKTYYASMAKSYGASDLKGFAEMQGMTEQQFIESSITPGAENMAKQHLAAEAIAAKEGIDVSDDDVKTEIDKIVKQQNVEVSKLEENYKSMYGSSMSLNDYFKIMLKQNKVVELVGKNAKIKE
ncbi:trigger factor [Eubacterium xylanophilum]|uniref:trigger factor n=1 Tax=Eubacterium xylanophilum TaxID=39497 RepID=UPI0004B786C3|nr:trigger factor [Eubacterium xylanophilum]